MTGKDVRYCLVSTITTFMLSVMLLFAFNLDRCNPEQTAHAALPQAAVHAVAHVLPAAEIEPPAVIGAKEAAAPSSKDSGRPLALMAGSEALEPGQMMQLSIGGLTIDQAKKAATTVYPREKVTFYPCATWGGTPTLMFSARLPGKYLIGIYSPNADGQVQKAETVVTVTGGSDDKPNPQPPAPTPLPTPAQKIWLIVVEDTLQRPTTRWQVERTLQNYATSKQASRWKLLDHKETDSAGHAPAGFARFQAAAGGKDSLFIVAADDKGQTLWAGPVTDDPATALKLAQQYGGQ